MIDEQREALIQLAARIERYGKVMPGQHADGRLKTPEEIKAEF